MAVRLARIAAVADRVTIRKIRIVKVGLTREKQDRKSRKISCSFVILSHRSEIGNELIPVSHKCHAKRAGNDDLKCHATEGLWNKPFRGWLVPTCPSESGPRTNK